MDQAEVLIIEDDEPTREVLVDLLQAAGYRVYEAPAGKPALERLRAHPKGFVVLLDLLMPGMDGFAVLQAMAAEVPLATRHAYLLVSAEAGWLPPKLLPLIKQLHVLVIPKPFDLDELLGAVHHAADRLRHAT